MRAAERLRQPPHRRLLGPRVRVQVAGGGLEVGVAEEFLHGPDVHAGTDEVGGEGVAEAVDSVALAEAVQEGRDRVGVSGPGELSAARSGTRYRGRAR